MLSSCSSLRTLTAAMYLPRSLMKAFLSLSWKVVRCSDTCVSFSSVRRTLPSACLKLLTSFCVPLTRSCSRGQRHLSLVSGPLGAHRLHRHSVEGREARLSCFLSRPPGVVLALLLPPREGCCPRHCSAHSGHSAHSWDHCDFLPMWGPSSRYRAVSGAPPSDGSRVGEGSVLDP